MREEHVGRQGLERDCSDRDTFEASARFLLLKDEERADAAVLVLVCGMRPHSQRSAH